MGFGSWPTAEESVDSLMEDAPMTPQHTEKDTTEMRESRRSNRSSRPQLVREATVGESRYINNQWSQATESMLDMAQAEELTAQTSQACRFLTQYRTSPTKDSNRTMKRKLVNPRYRSRPQERIETGLVNSWWSERLRADSVTPPDAVKVAAASRFVVTASREDTASSTASKREFAIVSKNLEIWVTPPPEENRAAFRIYPRLDPKSQRQDTQNTNSWRESFLASLPLVSSLDERPRSPKHTLEDDPEEIKIQREAKEFASKIGTSPNTSKRSFESLYLIQDEDLQPSLPHGVINPDPLEPINLEGNSIWSSQLVSELDLVESSFDWDFAPLERVATRRPEQQQSRNLSEGKPYWDANLVGQPSQPVPGLDLNTVETPSRTAGFNPLSSHPTESRIPPNQLQEYEETDIEIDELDQDIETCSIASWGTTSSDSSDDSSDSSDDDFPDSYFDPDPTNTWYDDLPSRPESPGPDSGRRELVEYDPVTDGQYPEIEEWMKEKHPELYSSDATSTSTTDEPSSPSSCADSWAKASVPVSVLETDPKYADEESVANPQLAQFLLTQRALNPQRRKSMYPSRKEIVIQPAEVPPYRADGLLGSFYQRLEEEHAKVDVQNVSVNF